MKRMFGAYEKAQRMKKCRRYGCCWEPPQRTRGGSRLGERRTWQAEWEQEKGSGETSR